MAAEFPKRKRRLAAQIARNVKSARHRKIGAATCTFDRLKFERLTGLNLKGFPHRLPAPTNLGLHVGSRHADDGSMVEP